MGRPLAVLVVDDMPDILVLIEAYLDDAGLHVETATNGEEAVAKLLASTTRYGALITDIDLGGAVDGYEVARCARSLNPEISVAYISGNPVPEWSDRAVRGSRLLRKPFPLATLAGLVTAESVGVSRN